MNGEPLIRLLADLVAIPSVNPMGRGKSGPGYGEHEVAAYVAAYMRSRGVDAVLSEVSPGRPNLTARIDAGARETLLLEAHADTVQADAMTIPPFAPEVRDGKLYGRGACDTKGSLAAFLHAVCSLIDAGGKFRYNIVLLVAADEEYQFTGARHAVAGGLAADFAIVGEPTLLTIVRAHKGVTRWRIVTRGVAAHSAYPERGRNAIYAMGPLLVRLESYARALREGAGHPLLGSPSLSVGVIEGGEAVNIVPERCTVEVDRRTLPGESAEDILGAVRSALGDIPGWEFEPPHLVAGAMEVPLESPIVRSLSGAIGSVCGGVRDRVGAVCHRRGDLRRGGDPRGRVRPGRHRAGTHRRGMD